jgi:hypothetical protein
MRPYVRPQEIRNDRFNLQLSFGGSAQKTQPTTKARTSMRSYVRPQETHNDRFNFPLSSGSSAQKTLPTTKAHKSMIAILFAITFSLSSVLVIDPALRLLSDIRRLACTTYFLGDLSGDSPYWEETYPAVTDYPGEPRTLPGGPNNIGFVVTLSKCPSDIIYQPGVDTQYDPGHALYDAAAVLKHSITTKLAVSGKYNATMHAIVHPDAISCDNPNGDSYDRVKVLESLGYYVNIQASPIVNPLEITDPNVQSLLSSDAGDRDLTSLYAATYDNHPAVGKKSLCFSKM